MFRLGAEIKPKTVTGSTLYRQIRTPVCRPGDPGFTTFLDFSAKPFQMPALFRSGVVGHFSFSDQDIALFTASHNGGNFHIDGVRKILRQTGLDETFLKCGFHPPYDQKALEKFYAVHSDPSPIYNNCSGEHAGMPAAYVLHNDDLATYSEPDDPHQRLIKQIVSGFSEISAVKIETAAFRLFIYRCARGQK